MLYILAEKLDFQSLHDNFQVILELWGIIFVFLANPEFQHVIDET